MANDTYWANRALKRENEAYLKSTALLLKQFREYERAAKEIKSKVAEFYARYANKYGLTYEEAVKRLNKREYQEWKATLGEYVERIAQTEDEAVKRALTMQLDALSANSQITRLSALEGQINLVLNDLYDRGIKQMKEEFGAAFIEGYYKKSFDIQSRAGFENVIAKIDYPMIEDVITYPWSGAAYSERLWKNKEALVFNLRETLTQGLIQGKSINAMSLEMSNKMGQSFKNAERLIRTETARIHSEADKQAYKAAKIEEYEFMATLEKRTCEVCGALDGKHFFVNDAKIGINYPPIHPNCRCTTIEFDFDDALDWYNTGQPMPQNMKYKDWYDGQVRKNGQGSVEVERIRAKNRLIESLQDKVYNKGVEFSDKQFGKKVGKHALDFGLNPADINSRKSMEDIINDIVKNRDEIVHGTWRGQGELLPSGRRADGPVEFIIKGNDVVVAHNGKFITILKDGIHNTRVKRAKKKAGGNK